VPRCLASVKASTLSAKKAQMLLNQAAFFYCTQFLVHISHHQATMTSTATQVALRLMAAWTQWRKPQTQTAQVTKAEAERLSAVMTADVVDHADAPPRAVKHKKPAKKSNKGSTKSGICAVQWQQPPAHNCIEIRG
jgi:hypothetical protein